jgi:hypothetical protein
MGTTFQADVPGNVYHHTMSFASRASNAADDVIDFFHALGHTVSVLSVYYVPHISQAGSATNYDDWKLINMGSGSAGTAVVASKTFSATGASVQAETPSSLSVASAAIASNEHLGISRVSAGNGIALVAHTIHMAYRYT